MKPKNMRYTKHRGPTHGQTARAKRKRRRKGRKATKVKKIDCPDGLVFATFIGEHDRFIKKIINYFEIPVVETRPITPRRSKAIQEMEEPIVFIHHGGSNGRYFFVYRFFDYDPNIRQDIIFYAKREKFPKIQKKIADYSGKLLEKRLEENEDKVRDSRRHYAASV